MSIEVIAGIATAAFLGWAWLVARSPAPAAPPRVSSLTPARERELYQMGAEVGASGGASLDYIGNELRRLREER